MPMVQNWPGEWMPCKKIVNNSSFSSTHSIVIIVTIISADLDSSLISS